MGLRGLTVGAGKVRAGKGWEWDGLVMGWLVVVSSLGLCVLRWVEAWVWVWPL